MNNDQIGFVLKVLLLSTLLSILIKYGGRYVPLAPTPINALIGISVLPLMMLIALLWRSREPQK